MYEQTNREPLEEEKIDFNGFRAENTKRSTEAVSHRSNVRIL